MPIRSATAADIPAMMDLAREPHTAQWSRSHYEQIFTVATPARFALVAEDGNTLHGFLVGQNLGPEWELENIVVLPAARRHGLGAALLESFLAQARAHGCEAVFLEVRESNVPARTFYEKHQFRETGRRKLYYTDPQEDAVLYRLPLS